VIPITFLAGCAFAAVALCFTALIPTIDHMNLPIFLLVLPLGFASATYFPLSHPTVVAIATFNPLYHLAEGLRGLLLGGGALYHLAVLTGSCLLLIAVLVPLDMRLLQRRVLGE
jgi:lipooligosaccharide transport system permease protein